MATSNRKSAAFVLTREGKSSIFKQNDGITLNLTSFALFQDKNQVLKRLLESSSYDYTILENLKYDYFNNDNFILKRYDNSLKPDVRFENGERVVCLSVDIFNDNETNDAQTYDGIIYFCNAYQDGAQQLLDLKESQNANVIYAIQYFATNKISILADQDKRIRFAIQLRFTQNNYEVIDLNIPDNIDNGIRIYNDALTNISLRSKTVGTNRALTIGSNPNEVGSMLDIFADAGSNQARFISLKQNVLNDYTIGGEIDVKFDTNTFVVSGNNVSSFELFSKDNETAGTSLFAFSNDNIIDSANSGKYTFLNSNSNTADNASVGNVYIASNNNESLDGNNTFIGSDRIVGNYSNDTFIASNSISFIALNNIKSNASANEHNTFINEHNDGISAVKNFVAIGGNNSNFINIENGLAIGHNLNIGSTSKKLSDVVVFGKYNAPIEENDIFVLANGNASTANNVFKVKSNGQMILNNGSNKTIISPTGIGHNDSNISFGILEQIVNNQTTLNDLNSQLDELESAVLNVINNGLNNKSFILNGSFNVDENISSEEKGNNLLVTLYNPIENNVTVTYRYYQPTIMSNPQTATITVGNKSTIQLIYIDTTDYKGFAQVR